MEVNQEMDDEREPARWDKKAKHKAFAFCFILLLYLSFCTVGAAWALSVRYADSGLSNGEIFILQLPVLAKGFLVAIVATYFWQWYFLKRKKKK